MSDSATTYEKRVSVAVSLRLPADGSDDVNATFETKSVSYRLDQSLPLDDMLVLDRRKKLLGQIQLDKMVENLGRLTLLVDLAYNAVPKREGALVASLNRMQTDYGSLCQQCSTAMGELRSCGEEISLALNEAMEDLFRGNEDLAIGGISDCASIAGRLASLMKDLSDAFNDLATRADSALETAHLTRGDEIKAQEALEHARLEWSARKAKADKLSEELSTLLGELQTKYDKLEKKLEKTEDRAFAIALTGAIMKPLGDGLGGAATAIALIYSGAPSNGGGGGNGGEQKGGQGAPKDKPEAGEAEIPEKNRKELEESEDAYEDSVLAVDVAEEDEEALQAEIDVLEEEIAAADEDADGLSQLKEHKATLEHAKQAVEQVKAERVKTAEERERDFQTTKSAVEALGYTLSSAGEQFSQMGHDYLDLAEGQREQLERLFDLLMQKKDLEREQLGIVAEAGVRLEGIDADLESSAVTIKALVMVIAALRQVSDILHDAAKFWEAMESGCNKLASPDFMKGLERRRNSLKADATPDERAEIFNLESVKLRLLNYKSDWAALQNVAQEYAEHTDDLYQDARERRSTTLVGKAVKARVDALATKLIGDVKAAQEEIDRELAAMKASRAEHEQGTESKVA
ncbi:hypothetical protein KUV62_13580 [Salipiger bermudensis]|uniref:hypothetical protein n=1 Tax=Salipiger bermudensis TaxID=344736 RepID=UPI001C998011|nr:hypothetical protein [Salipiger bermudensis]MBY6004946.1 hypothetical protein [Salipiger bermudensis]